MLRITGNDAPVENLTRLSGGANMESSAFTHAGRAYVLRRAPSPAMMQGRPFGHDVEAALIRVAHRAGVCAPQVLGELVASDGLGSGYVMAKVEAEVAPAKILAAPPSALLDQLARELALLHAVPLALLDPDMAGQLPRSTPAQQVQKLMDDFRVAGGNRPVMALALRWLQDHLPPTTEAVLLHGDFRMGNLMVRLEGDQPGLAAVLDWELAHLGDRHQDLAYGCINSWRFGHMDRPAFGLGSLADFWNAYAHHSGTQVDATRFRFWMVYCTLWWGLTCLRMAAIWREGVDKSLERAVIGRRASETELDLLMLLEQDAPLAARQPNAPISPISPISPFVPIAPVISNSVHPEPVEGPQPLRQAPSEPMEFSICAASGEPSTAEMLSAISDWLATDIKPQAAGRNKFMLAVAQNALGMLAREAAAPPPAFDKSLSDALLAGTQSLQSPGLLARLQQDTLAKVAVDQPRYSALAPARQRWQQT